MSNTVLLLHFNGADGSTTITDSSLYNFPLTKGSNGTTALSSVQTKFGNTYLCNSGSTVGPGSNSGIYPTTKSLVSGSWIPSQFQLNTDFTIEAFTYLRPNTAGGQFAILCGIGTPRGNFGFWNLNGTPTFEFEWSSNGTYTAGTGGAGYYVCRWTLTSAILNSWHHMAVVRSGNELMFFLDGVKQTGTVSTGTGRTITDIFLAGNPYVGLGGAVTGNVAIADIGGPYTDYGFRNSYMDEFRWSNVARYTSNFTVTSTEFSAGRSQEFILPIEEIETYLVTLAKDRPFQASIEQTETITLATIARNRALQKTIAENAEISSVLDRIRAYSQQNDQLSSLLSDLNRTRILTPTISETAGFTPALSRIKLLVQEIYEVSDFIIDFYYVTNSKSFSFSFEETSNYQITATKPRLFSSLLSLTESIQLQADRIREIQTSYNEIEDIYNLLGRELKLELTSQSTETLYVTLERIKQCTTQIDEVENLDFTVTSFRELPGSILLEVQYDTWNNLSLTKLRSSFDFTTTTNEYTFVSSSASTHEFSLINT